MVYKNERPLFLLSMVIGSLAWVAIVVGTLGVGLIYVLVFVIIYLFAYSGFISHLRGNAVELSERQFPDLYAQYVETCRRLNVDDIPTAYLMMSNGVLNALAARFLRRNYVVVYSSVVDALRSKPEALRFYFGHELAHIIRGHLRLQWLRWPASVLPLLGAAYRRAQEYTCDLHGLAAANSPDDALAALGVLGTGGAKIAHLDTQVFIDQQDDTDGFWMSYHELTSDYPWLCKRLAHVASVGASGSAQYEAPRRNVAAGFLAALTPRFGVGGSSSMLVTVIMIGVLAAIAIPAYEDYSVRAELVPAWTVVQKVETAANEYVEKNQAFPSSPSDVGIPETLESGPVSQIKTTKSGFELVIRSRRTNVNGTTIVVGAYLKDGGKIGWTCDGGTLPAKYRPPQCRPGS